MLRLVCGKFPYRAPGKPSIVTDPKLLGEAMRELMQDKCNICGVRVLSLEIMEAAYSPEVASSLL